MSKRKRTDGGCTPIVENKFIPKPCKRYKVQIEMPITRELQEKLAREKGLEDVWDIPIGRGRPRRPRGCGSPE